MHRQLVVAILEFIRRTRRQTICAVLVAAPLLLGVSSAHAAAPANLFLRAIARSFVVGLPGTFRVTVFNRGPSTTDDVVTVSYALPAGVSFASNTGDWICAADGATVTCTNTIALSPGNSTFQLVVNVTEAALPRVLNQFTLSYAGDTTPLNNTLNRYTLVRRPRFPIPTQPPTLTPPPTPTLPPGTPIPTNTFAPTATFTATLTPVPAATDLKLSKTVSGTFTVGSNGAYLLTVTNLGTSATSSRITVVDALPTGLGFVSGTGTGWTCSAAGATVTCMNDLAVTPGASTSITLTVSIEDAAFPTVTNSATLSYAGDTDATNNTSNRPTTIRS